MTPRVSIIVPVRDRRALLRACLDGLDAQTLRDYEVVVVDDGSSDGSGGEAVRDAAAGRPVHLVAGDGLGAVAARTLGVKAAAGEILAFTDSDCVPEPEWLERCVAAIDAGADYAQGTTLPARPPKRFERTVYVTFDDGLHATCNAAYRRAAFDAAGGFDTDAARRLGFRHGDRLRGLGFGEDTLLGWRVRRAGIGVFVDDAVVHHAVFPVDLGDTARRTWAAGGFPALVREAPELRGTLLRHGWLLSRGSRLPLYAAAVALCLRRPRLALGLAAGWAGAHTARVLREERSWRNVARALPVELGLDALTAAALVSGSVRARSVVL